MKFIKKKDEFPKISFWDVYVKDPIKAWAGVKNEDNTVGKLDEYSKILERKMSDLSQQEAGFRNEFAKEIAEGLKKGIFKYSDFNLAIEKVKIKYIDENGKIKYRKGYDYDEYLKKIDEIINKNNISLNCLDKETYTAITAIQSIIEDINKEHKLLETEKRKIDRMVEDRGKIYKTRKRK